jgi:hypothetical protein
MTDEELRDRLGAWARLIEAAPAPDIEVIRRRARRRLRRAAWTAAACAAALALAVSVVVPRLIAGTGAPADSGVPATGWHPAGPLAEPDAGPASAPYLVVLDIQRTGSPAVVYRVSASEPRPRPIATVPLPRPGVTMTDVAGAADDRTFVLVGTSFSGRSLVTRYYELQLGPDGRPGRLVTLRLAVPGPPPGGLGIAAISPDGTRLAVAAQTGGPATLVVLSLATGAVRTWTAPGRAAQLGSMSWDGSRRLAFLWTAAGSDHPELRLLDTSSGGSRLMTSSRLLIPATVRFGGYSGLAYAPVTAGGQAVFALMPEPLRPPAGPGSRLAVVAFSAGTGQPIRVIARAAQSGMGSYCGVVWADRSGRQLVTSCGYHLGSTKNGTFTLWSGRSFWYSLRGVPFAW